MSSLGLHILEIANVGESFLKINGFVKPKRTRGVIDINTKLGYFYTYACKRGIWLGVSAKTIVSSRANG